MVHFLQGEFGGKFDSRVGGDPFAGSKPDRLGALEIPSAPFRILVGRPSLTVKPVMTV